MAISLALHEILAGLLPAAHVQSQHAEIVRQLNPLRITIRPRRRLTSPRAHRAAPAPLLPTMEGSAATMRSSSPTVVRRRAPGSTMASRALAARAAVTLTTETQREAADRSASGTGTVGATAQDKGNGTGGTGDTSAGGSGAGTARLSPDPPCGFVMFSDPHGSQYDPKTRGFWVDIRMAVHFPDGSSQSLILDYPWYYPNEAANPWSAQNLKDPSFPTRFQPPPSDRASGEPALVKYVADHSDAQGMTMLRDCAPAPAL